MIDGGAGNDSIENHGYKVKISGGAGNDSLVSGGGNNSLWGGKGNDTLLSGYGDVFIYAKGDGKDIIFGFDDNDTLTLDNLEFTSASYSKSKGTVTLKLDGGSITLKDFTAETFHINDDTYKISDSKFVKQN